jgi:hypothetical protein
LTPAVLDPTISCCLKNRRTKTGMEERTSFRARFGAKAEEEK